MKLGRGVNFAMKTKKGNLKDLLKGLFFVVLIGGVLTGILSVMLGRSPMSRAERQVYKTVNGAELALWIYKPKGWKPSDARPCVLWFFGGGWKVGSPQQFVAQSKYFAKRGLVSIVADYRVESRHGSSPFDSVEDARSAMRWLKVHATELGIDEDKIAAAGGSSGGHLALACEVFSEANKTTDAVAISARPAALILFNPVVNMDIPQIRKRVTEDEMDRLLEISPHHQLSRALPPTVIFQGLADPIVPAQSVTAFVEKAKSLDSDKIIYYTYQARGHEFYYGPGSRKDYQDTLNKVIRFLESLGWL